MASKVIPASEVKEGQKFKHFGQIYIRATAAECKKHMCVPMLKTRPDLVLVFTDGEEHMPATFNPDEKVALKPAKKQKEKS